MRRWILGLVLVMAAFGLAIAQSVGTRPEEGQERQGDERRRRDTQPNRQALVERGEYIVHHVALRNDGKILLQGIEVNVEVFAVEQHTSFVRGNTSAERGQQCCLAGTTGAENTHKFTRPHD